MALVSLRENTSHNQRLRTKNWLHGFGKLMREHITQSKAEDIKLAAWLW
jgi:response regulator RpfG family c-di-GMP phosphodiesterase